MPEMPWRDAYIVDDNALAAAIAAADPALTGLAVETFGEGWDNRAFLVDARAVVVGRHSGRRVVVRVARRALAVDLLHAEARVLPKLAATVAPVAVPAPTLITDVATTTGERVPVVGYPIVEGTTLCRTGLDDDARVGLAAPLGAFLRALHGLHGEALSALALPSDTLNRANLASRVAVTRERLRAAHAHGLVTDADLTALLACAPPDRVAGDDVCAHGDLYARHVVVDDVGALAGVIDWGDIHAGDRALDLAIAHVALPLGAHGAFRAAYGDIDDVTWRRARFRAVFSAASTAVYGADINDADLVSESRRALARLVASHQRRVCS